MSLFTEPVRRSFDEDSDATLLASDRDDFSDIEIIREKVQAYESWQSRFQIPPRPMLSSASGLTRLSAGFAYLVSYFLPSFLQTQLEDGKQDDKPLHPTAYLDGMRGLAAFAVFLCHLSYGTWDITRSYGTPAAKDDEPNNWLFQLPIVRLVYSGPPMVAIFFVISGYVLSYKPIRLIRAQQLDQLMTTTSSSIFRRAIRLYLPCFVSTFMIGCLVQMGIYGLTAEFAESLPRVHEHHLSATTTNMEQFWNWTRSMFNFVHIFDWGLYAGATNFDPHLWTIPAEYRCSLLLFMTHILTARMPTRLRIGTILFLIYWGAHWDRWDMTVFWAGQILAELHHIKNARASRDQSAPDTGLSRGRSALRSCHNGIVSKVFYVAVFLIGCYFASAPDADGHIAPGYRYLDSLIPKYWSQRHRFWGNVGAVLIVWSAGNTDVLQRIFETPAVQYIGRISFPLYCMHGPIIQTFGYWLMMNTYDVLNAGTMWQYQLGFVFSALWTIVVVIWASDLFLRFVDTPSVKLARWLEDKFFI